MTELNQTSSGLSIEKVIRILMQHKRNEIHVAQAVRLIQSMAPAFYTRDQRRTRLLPFLLCLPFFICRLHLPTTLQSAENRGGHKGYLEFFRACHLEAFFTEAEKSVRPFLMNFHSTSSTCLILFFF